MTFQLLTIQVATTALLLMSCNSSVSPRAPDFETLAVEFIQLSMLNEDAKAMSLVENNLVGPFYSLMKPSPALQPQSPPLAEAAEKNNLLAMREFLRHELNSSSSEELIDWLRNSGVQKFVQLQHQENVPVEFDVFKKNLQSNPSPIERIQLLERLDAAQGKSRNLSSQSFSLSSALIQAVGGKTNYNPKDDLRNVLDTTTLTTLDSALKEQVLLGNLFLYRSLSLQELKEYVEMSESALGKRYSELVLGARGVANKRMFERYFETIRKVKTETSRSPEHQESYQNGK